MKSVQESLLEGRSIRRYERIKVEPEKMQQIYDAIRNTPTSYNGQQFSVIVIDDQPLKEQIYEITNQKQIKTCSHFLVFCTDFHKLRVAAALHGEETPAFESTIDGYTVGVIDASLAMMSAVSSRITRIRLLLHWIYPHGRSTETFWYAGLTRGGIHRLRIGYRLPTRDARPETQITPTHCYSSQSLQHRWRDEAAVGRLRSRSYPI